MTRTIKVHHTGRSMPEIREVDVKEAQQILEDAVAIGWVVVNAKTHEAISEIRVDIDEIQIIVGLFDGG